MSSATFTFNVVTLWRREKNLRQCTAVAAALERDLTAFLALPLVGDGEDVDALEKVREYLLRIGSHWYSEQAQRKARRSRLNKECNTTISDFQHIAHEAERIRSENQ